MTTKYQQVLLKGFAEKVADAFVASGITYTCGQVVLSFADQFIADFRAENDVTVSDWKLKRAAWDEVHKRRGDAR